MLTDRQPSILLGIFIRAKSISSLLSTSPASVLEWYSWKNNPHVRVGWRHRAAGISREAGRSSPRHVMPTLRIARLPVLSSPSAIQTSPSDFPPLPDNSSRYSSGIRQDSEAGGCGQTFHLKPCPARRYTG